jgi:hypothetical protein
MSDRPAKLTVRVQPSASRNAIVRFADGVLHVKIAAPPVGGRANRELIAFFSQVLGVPRASLSIEKGATNRMKVIRVEALSEEEVRRRVVSSSP